MPRSPSALYSHAATILPVADVARSAAFYRDRLGFTVEFEWEDPPSYAVLSAGDGVSVHLSLVDHPRPPDARGTLIYLFVHDVDALHASLVEAGVVMHSSPETMPYGMREFEVVDPDGHRFVFGMGV